MTPEEINMAIAEHLGWTHIEMRGMNEMDHDILSGLAPFMSYHQAIPNYHGDLNAMSLAEDSLSRAEAVIYHDALREAIPHPKDAICAADRWTWHATASQRAETFLRTVGKWKEGA